MIAMRFSVVMRLSSQNWCVLPVLCFQEHVRLGIRVCSASVVYHRELRNQSTIRQSEESAPTWSQDFPLVPAQHTFVGPHMLAHAPT